MDRKIYGKEILLDSVEPESGETYSFSKPYRPGRRRRVFLNSLFYYPAKSLKLVTEGVTATGNDPNEMHEARKTPIFT